MSDLLNQMGERIKKRRKEMYFTQEKLAERAGVTTQTISSAEHGSKALRPENIVKISAALEVSTDYLLLGTTSPLDQYLFIEKVSRLPSEQRRYLEIIINSYFAAVETGGR